MPQMPLVNLFSEAAITEPRQFTLQSFPPLKATATAMGNGPIKALLQAGGVLSGQLVGISGGGVYVAGASVGTIVGNGAASIAGNEIGAVLTAGADAVFYDGTDFSTVAFPDGRSVIKVFEQGGRFLFIPKGGQAWFWTAPYSDMLGGGGEIVIGGLDFASAENEPDRLLDGLVVGDTPILGGANTIEFWAKTGDLNAPYVPIEGRVFQKGVRATGCMALFDNSFGWVSPDHIVYVAGNVPERISDSGIEELIAASASCRVDSYFFEGHEFLKIKLTFADGSGLTIEYDAQTRQWNERRTGVGPFDGGPVVAGPLFGSASDGAIYELAGFAGVAEPHERSFCAGIPINGGTVQVDALALRTNPGHTDFLNGDYADPQVEFFQSYDGGQTYVEGLPASLGEAGEYRREVEWRALGSADAPGFFGKFRLTDPVPWRVSGVMVNELHGGRSR